MDRVLSILAAAAGMWLGHYLYQEYKKANAPQEQTVNMRDVFMASRPHSSDDEE